MQPIFKINDRVKLQSDDIIYIVKEVKIEKYKIEYFIHSEDEEHFYRLWADEKALTKV